MQRTLYLFKQINNYNTGARSGTQRTGDPITSEIPFWTVLSCLLRDYYNNYTGTHHFRAILDNPVILDFTILLTITVGSSLVMINSLYFLEDLSKKFNPRMDNNKVDGKVDGKVGQSQSKIPRRPGNP